MKLCWMRDYDFYKKELEILKNDQTKYNRQAMPLYQETKLYRIKLYSKIVELIEEDKMTHELQYELLHTRYDAWPKIQKACASLASEGRTIKITELTESEVTVAKQMARAKIETMFEKV